MLINEVSKRTNLTKKAIEYYGKQRLIFPTVLENGYREYSETDMETLSKIRVLRKLDISIDEIRKILEDESNGRTNKKTNNKTNGTTNETLQKLAMKKELDLRRDINKNSILQDLSQGKTYKEAELRLQALEQGKSITDKLLEAFPDYYGRLICMHFSSFLNEPIVTREQQDAYETIIEFLDNIPDWNMPEEIEEYFTENTKEIGVTQINDILENTRKSYENMDEFLMDKKEFVDRYLEYKKTDEYKNSLACKLADFLKEFNSISGYNEIFIPAMKELSPSYAMYYVQIQTANEKFLEQYPQL